MITTAKRQSGFTIIELTISLAITALLLAAMAGLIDTAFESRADTSEENDVVQDARFAMQRMLAATRGTGRLLLPLADNPATSWRENVREQTVPASAPEGGSILATAVLAVTLDPDLDIDADGVKDADNDLDGRIDEDLGKDNTNDQAPGIVGIDDDGDGNVDVSTAAIPKEDNDEDGAPGDDPVDALDNDNDGSVDEDIGDDMNGDAAPGVVGIDDDGDGMVDEGVAPDDDEDGQLNEDWLDVVVFFLSGAELIERRPNLSPVDGNDFTEHVIAEGVSRFRVERISGAGKRAVLVDITLELAKADGEIVSLNARLRPGGVK